MIDKFITINWTKYFSLGIFQNYLVLTPTKKYIKNFTSTTLVESRKSDGMSQETIENKTKSDNNFAPTFVDHHSFPDISCNGHYLINK